MIVAAILIALAFAYFFQRTTLGYNIRAAGTGPGPAEAKGISTKRMKVIAMLIGGAVAGLAGVGDVLGAGHACGVQACLQVNFASGWFGGEGFAGIAVALVAASSPLGAIFSAFFFSILVAGAPLASAGGPQLYLIWALQGIIIIFMAMPHLSKLVLKETRRLTARRGGGR
jgi:general nucleoside transport system permease protein